MDKTRLLLESTVDILEYKAALEKLLTAGETLCRHVGDRNSDQLIKAVIQYTKIHNEVEKLV